tara:strand:- start:441 stop:887 length:447 start_codon:yes stop_codon:yes gene_type:complete
MIIKPVSNQEMSIFQTLNATQKVCVYEHIIKQYSHLPFEEMTITVQDGDICDEACMFDCVMMEHSIRNLSQLDHQDKYINGDATIKKYMRDIWWLQHSMFRIFFDQQDKWSEWYMEEYSEMPENYKTQAELKIILNGLVENWEEDAPQ